MSNPEYFPSMSKTYKDLLLPSKVCFIQGEVTQINMNNSLTVSMSHSLDTEDAKISKSVQFDILIICTSAFKAKTQHNIFRSSALTLAERTLELQNMNRTIDNTKTVVIKDETL